jgi:diguanylate cyclase (GGDEF)-like protein
MLSTLMALIYGVSCLSLVALGYLLAAPALKARATIRELVLGALFAVGAILCMIQPIMHQGGIHFDGSSILPALAAPFIGPWGTVLAIAIPGLFRLNLGGPTAVSGAMSPVLAGFMGWAMWRLIGRQSNIPDFRQLAILTVAAGSIPVMSFLLIPNGTLATALFIQHGPTMLVADWAGIFILGAVLRFGLLKADAVAATNRAEAMLSGMFENAEAAHFVTTPDGTGDFRVCAANGRALQSVGRPRDQVVGHLISDYLSPARLTLITNAHRRALETMAKVQWEEQVDVGGEKRRFEIALVPVAGTDDVPTMIYATKRDVTLQREGEYAREIAATTDSLTGLRNRRFVEEKLAEEFVRAKRYREPLSVLMIDLDHFKDVNNTYGHEAGDRVLKHFAHVLQELARSTDTVARWGGEEFMMVAPKTDISGALLAANRLCTSARDEVVRVDEHVIRFTVSIGVAQLREEATPAQLVRAADKVLYQAKKAGRNRAIASMEPATVYH